MVSQFPLSEVHNWLLSFVDIEREVIVAATANQAFYLSLVY